MLKSLEFSKIKNSVRSTRKNNNYKVLYLSDGSIAKVFTASFLRRSKKNGLQLERRVLESESIQIPELNLPTGIIYKNGKFCGYTIKQISGKTYAELVEDISDLGEIATLIKKLEEVIKKGNEQGIVFPNINLDTIIKLPNDEICLTDFDEIQYKDMQALKLSDLVKSEVLGAKYMQDDTLFTPEIDKLSIILLYLKVACGIDLIEYIKKSSNNRMKKHIITDLLLELGISEELFARRVLNLFEDDIENYFVGDDLIRIANKYQLVEDGISKKFRRK